MKRTVIFVLIVAVVAGLFSFGVTALTAGAARHPDPTFAAAAIGMVAGIVYLRFSGNRPMPVADSAARAAALATAPPPDAARLLVVRQSMLATMIGIDVLVDDVVMTQLRSPRFAILTLSPGRHEVVAAVQGRRVKPITLDLAAGETAVVRIAAGVGQVRLRPEPDTPALRASLARTPMVREAT